MPRSLAYDPKNALNAICPYFTMFPLEYPLRVLRKHRNYSPIVLDPFCGRGTTLFAARSLGLTSKGIDSSPVAVAIAKSKLAAIEIKDTLDLAQNFVDSYKLSDVPEIDFFRHAFDTNVLEEICAIRYGLSILPIETDASILLRATMLGCLHGPTSKRQEAQSYFSNQMPRTFSCKPDYAIRYWRERNLSAPKLSVIEVLRRKLSRIGLTRRPSEESFKKVFCLDSRFQESLPDNELDFSLVVTSPPYYGMRTYVEDQWLRNWFLGGPAEVEYGNRKQLNHSSISAFTESLGLVWKNMARTKAHSLHMYIRFGIIPSSKVEPRSLIKASLEASEASWRVVSIRQAKTASSGKRQADHMKANSTAAVEYDFHVERI